MASVLAAFPTPTRMVVLENPRDMCKTMPLLPLHLNATVTRKRKPDDLDGSRRDTEVSNNMQKQAYNTEPRRMQLEQVMEYFCDTVGTVSEQGGVEDLTWGELEIRKSNRTSSAGVASEWEDIDVRYAVHKVPDETGYSGRDRLSVRFG